VAEPPLAPSAAEEAAATADVEEEEEEEEEPFVFEHPLMDAVFSGEAVESAEDEYIQSLMGSTDFDGLPDDVKKEVADDLAQELSQRLLDAETNAANATSEREFQMTIAQAIQGFDAMAMLVAEHVQTLKVNNSFKGDE